MSGAATMAAEPTILIVPGLRDAVALNPASGFGPRPDAHRLIDRVRTLAAAHEEH